MLQALASFFKHLFLLSNLKQTNTWYKVTRKVILYGAIWTKTSHDFKQTKNTKIELNNPNPKILMKIKSEEQKPWRKVTVCMLNVHVLNVVSVFEAKQTDSEMSSILLSFHWWKFAGLRKKQQVNLSVSRDSHPLISIQHITSSLTSSSRMNKPASIFVILLGLLFVSSQTDEAEGRSDDSRQLVSPNIPFNVLTSFTTGKVLIPQCTNTKST